jgi:hypothetical protein
VNRDLFCRLGEALFGPEWMAPLGAALDGVAPRTIARWASGYSRIPPNVQFEIRDLVRQRAVALGQLQAELDAALAQADQPPPARDRPPAT